MTLSRTSEQLIASVEEMLWDHFAIIADSLDDDGEADLADAWRYLARNKSMPFRRTKHCRLYWKWSKKIQLERGSLEDAISRAMFVLPCEGGLDPYCSWSLLGAYQRAATALATCGMSLRFAP